MATQYDIVQLPSVESTQDDARKWVESARTPVLILADEQNDGRGRQGREWAQPDRGMFASFGYVSDWDLPHRTLIPLVAAVAMRDAVRDSFQIALGLRWPNDLMLGSDKVGGLLVEASADTVVVGCGVNLWWEKPMHGAAGMLPVDPGQDAAPRLAESWADVLVRHLDGGSRRWPRAEYESASVTLGYEIVWGDGQGLAVAIADDGALVVESEGERIELRAGEVHTRGER
jgi:BirA family transcriptional regulator, biotin operon repressor / biotin---[acetyl-CoA-carboxylase] ligase